MLEEALVDDHEVVVAHSADKGIIAGLKFQPHLIISDWDLKEKMDGVGVCQKILQHHKAIIIFVSGYPLDQLNEASEALAPLPILEKPIDIDNLISLIGGISVESDREEVCRSVI